MSKTLQHEMKHVKQKRLGDYCSIKIGVRKLQYCGISEESVDF